MGRLELVVDPVCRAPSRLGDDHCLQCRERDSGRLVVLLSGAATLRWSNTSWVGKPVRAWKRAVNTPLSQSFDLLYVDGRVLVVRVRDSIIRMPEPVIEALDQSVRDPANV
jgi:hypothetical protein